MREYQPIVKNLKNMALRNRNLIGSVNCTQMPLFRANSLNDRQPGSTSDPGSPQCPSSPMRKQFYHKYLDEMEGNKPESRAVGIKIRNMVYAYKKEMIQEKQVVSYMINEVLNPSTRTKITGITTQQDLEKRAADNRSKRQHKAIMEAKRCETTSIDS